MVRKDSDRPVYSSELGRLCPGCGHALVACACGPPRGVLRAGRAVVVGRETSGRKGKGVTVVRGVPLQDRGELERLATRLKQLCASGGTLTKEGNIEVQGDHRDRIVRELQERGWVVKRSGG